ncbi:potassium channel family protein [Aureibacillus halotolerans]|uniref:Voltage-gated potassium channel n=1 Tax=Aureibacillus halotolerans TaxID=1508390 RepID=A0A4R6U6G6_9BACI|nr:potassium channel family protein [Aureibacillus halotolerans]TDQ41202.1 voltage-gated potassium channel [Aureibacillus halotolerans]
MHFFRKFAVQLIRLKNATVLLATLIFVAACTVVMYSLEPDNFGTIFNAFYFVLTTFATVGYGDFSPVTVIGKIVTILMYFIGIGLLGVVIGKIVDGFTVFKRRREEGKVAYMDKEHIVIIGWSKKAGIAMKEILENDEEMEIVVVDTLSETPVDPGEDRVHYIQGSVTNEETYVQANLDTAKAVIIFSDDTIQDLSLRDAKTLSIALTVERIAPNVHTTAEIMAKHHLANFAHVRVDDFLLSQDTISHMAVRSVMDQGISKVYTQLISQTDGADVFQVTPRPEWTTYREAFIQLLEQGATLIADEESMKLHHRLHDPLPQNARLFVLCDKATIVKIEGRAGE